MNFSAPSKGGIFGISLDATADMFPSFDMERTSDATADMFPSFDMERTSEHARATLGGSLGGITSMFASPEAPPPPQPRTPTRISTTPENKPPPAPTQQPEPMHLAPPVPPPPAPTRSTQAPAPPVPPSQLASTSHSNQSPPVPPSSSHGRSDGKGSSSNNNETQSSQQSSSNNNVKEESNVKRHQQQDDHGDEEDENFNLIHAPCNYQVLGLNQQIVNILLEPNQSVCCEPGVMIHCDPRVDIYSQCQFSISRCISGEKQVMSYYSNHSQSESFVIGLTPNTPNSKIIPVDMDDPLIKNKLTCLKGSWLASLGNADVSFQFDCRPVTCCFGGQGIRQQLVEGQGVVFLVGGGTVMRRVMERHERIVLDDHCLLAWSGTVGFAGRTAAERCRDLLCNFTGEGVFNFVISGGEKGGVIYIQSMPFPKFKAGVTGVGDPKEY